MQNNQPFDETNRLIKKPTMKEPLLFFACSVLAALGAIIGIQLITSLGISANTSVLGALIAICVSRIPLAALARFRDIERQNLVQTAVSAGTFGAANALVIALGVPWVLGMPELIWPMFIGASLAMVVDATMIYKLFGSKTFPATGTWPAGIATAEALEAGDKGGKKALFLGAGITCGAGGAMYGIPMSAAGVALIGNKVALFMFAMGLLIRGYANTHTFTDYIPHIDINAIYLPHGFMIGAGLVALIQVIIQIYQSRTSVDVSNAEKEDSKRFIQILRNGYLGYLAVAIVITALSNIFVSMSLPMLVAFVLFAATAAIVQEMIVGIAAMYSGWFPAFAAALISLIVGMLIGFPPAALAVLVGFCASTGPAFADKGFDLKTGYLIRGSGQNMQAELYGRRQQYFAALLGFSIAMIMVALMHGTYFSQGLLAPASKAYAATIEAGSLPGVAMNIMLFAIPGAILQFLGGPSRQIGVLLATGLIINYPIAGWTVLVALALRVVIERYCQSLTSNISSFAGGLIAGDALYTAAKMFIPTLKAKIAAIFFK